MEIALETNNKGDVLVYPVIETGPNGFIDVRNVFTTQELATQYVKQNLIASGDFVEVFPDIHWRHPVNGVEFMIYTRELVHEDVSARILKSHEKWRQEQGFIIMQVPLKHAPGGVIDRGEMP